ncbi:helix-turn-helix transcriptional regulator [Chloroflexi bacterium CFX6]|nr:helix-turn-helix transcriptional regulator [Chloroflexi bacterium CFX6]
MFPELTGREHEVLVLIAEGLSNREIAENLVISESTVENHIHHIYGKLDITKRAQAVALAYQTGVIMVDAVLEK